MGRIESIKTRLYDVEFQTKKEWWGHEETILTSEEIKQESIVIRKALGKEYVMRNMRVEIKPDELIVGIANMNSVGFGRVFPDYALPSEKEAAAQVYTTTASVQGHHPADYAKVLRIGIDGIKKEVMAALAKESAKESPDVKKIDFYRGMIISLNAVIDLSNRYVQLAVGEAAKETDPRRRAELLEIARICAKVPEHPAESFHEALQSFWMVFIALHSCMELIPTGRSDQYLYPYLERDLQNGVITKEYAYELVVSWMAKFSERVQTNSDDWEEHSTRLQTQLVSKEPGDLHIVTQFSMDNNLAYNYGTSANHWLLNMIIGGVDREGRDATNDLTYMILDAWSYLEAVVPVLSVRFHKGSPQELYDRCARILRCGAGEPAIYNDDVIIDGLVKNGIPIEDARDYSNDGCWEVLVPGKTYFNYGHIVVLQLLEYMFNHGKSILRGEAESIDTGDPSDYKTFDEFYNAFLLHVRRQAKYLLDLQSRYFGSKSWIAPTPLLASMMDDCIERGLDAANGGARYNRYALVVTGLANCVDSLMAIKEMVYDRKAIGMSELQQALLSNFEGNEPLRQMLVNRVPKFGNDQEQVDDLAARLLDDCERIRAEIMEELQEDRFVSVMAIGTFENYARFGYNVGASADGRLARDTISSNYSPAISMDRSGPTAAMLSTTHPDLLPYITGCPLDIQINSNEAIGEEGVKRLSALIRSFMDLNGVILTVTGVSEEMLKDAQVHPEKHRGLRVRLGGLSAYFITLSPEQQDIIIRRTKNSV